MADSQLQYQQKENDDLKHDNTILYQKSVSNKERLDQVQVEVEELKRFIDSEKVKTTMLENDNKKQASKIQHLEDLLKAEKDRVYSKEHSIEELMKQREILQSEH